LVLELHAQLLDALVHLQDLFDLSRHLAETFHNIQPALLFAGAIFRK
jgi:hypothetical protein